MSNFFPQTFFSFCVYIEFILFTFIILLFYIVFQILCGVVIMYVSIIIFPMSIYVDIIKAKKNVFFCFLSNIFSNEFNIILALKQTVASWPITLENSLDLFSNISRNVQIYYLGLEV